MCICNVCITRCLDGSITVSIGDTQEDDLNTSKPNDILIRRTSSHHGKTKSEVKQLYLRSSGCKYLYPSCFGCHSKAQAE